MRPVRSAAIMIYKDWYKRDSERAAFLEAKIRELQFELIDIHLHMEKLSKDLKKISDYPSS